LGYVNQSGLSRKVRCFVVASHGLRPIELISGVTSISSRLSSIVWNVCNLTTLMCYNARMLLYLLLAVELTLQDKGHRFDYNTPIEETVIQCVFLVRTTIHALCRCKRSTTLCKRDMLVTSE
jgi:hypothetical protein